MQHKAWLLALRRVLAVAGVAVSCAACSASTTQAPRTPLKEMRKDLGKAGDANDVARWLMLELYETGGDAQQATRARKRLDELQGTSMLAHLARGIDDSIHGRLTTAPDHFLAATQAARASDSTLAPMIAWYSANRAVALRTNTHGLWDRWKSFVETSLSSPGNLGWRARSELADWWSEEAYQGAQEKVEEKTARQFGCAKNVRLAGPFGSGSHAATLQSFPAEAPGPWPQRFAYDPLVTSTVPRILADEEYACRVHVDEAVPPGIFYAETYLELPSEQSVLLAAQSALSVWVDDALVLQRKLTDWGTWPRFGVALRLAPGRHRVLVKLGEAGTSLRFMKPDGTPLDAKTSEDPSRPYHAEPPHVLPDPNLLMRYVHAGTLRQPATTIERIVAAHVAHVEGQDDVASVLLEPLLKDMTAASGPTLQLAGTFANSDPLFDQSQSEDLVRELNQRALQKDPDLWAAQLSLLLTSADSRGLADTVGELEKVVARFEQVAALQAALARVYGELGWVAEQRQTAKALAEKFPNNVDALLGALDAYDAEGSYDRADELVRRIRQLDPDTEVELARALVRQDYAKALAELERLKKRRPDREDLTQRIGDVLVLAGKRPEAIERLQAAIENDPADGHARLALADARFAAGNTAALAQALATALNEGAEAGPLLDAIDLVEGITELEPYRVAARPVIEAYEKSGRHMPGTAARILDYAAIWISSDGSSRMLEHEIIRIQSEEAIDKFAEHRRLEGLVLHMRVLKKDGRTLEPEAVSGKPTVTFPHLEVGDYIETEHVIYFQAEEGGDSYTGPRWFFREENVAYARSEFLVVAPTHQKLDIETTGNVPDPKVTQDGQFVTRHWRVDFSPAAPTEPLSAPVTEFLPSVRIGWGVTLEKRLLQLADAVTPVTPIDPRIRRIAENIVKPLPRSATKKRARQLYHWVLSNIQHGEELDGRRVIVGKNGNRWRALMMLCRALGIPTSYAIGKNQLEQPPRGPMSRAELYSIPVLRVGPAKSAEWLTVNDKHAPFGYIPAEARGMPAYLLDAGAPKKTQLPSDGAVDRLAYVGNMTLAGDGSADFEVVRRFEGKYAAQLRGGLEQVPERQLRDVLESRVLGSDLKGARLASYDIQRRDDLDAPLGLAMKGSVSQLAHPAGRGLSLPPPFTPRLSSIASLPTRQTPLLVREALDRTIRIEIRLPKGAKVALPKPTRLVEGPRSVVVSDRIEGQTLVLEREISLSAGRIQPNDYAGFADFIQHADEALNREIRIELR